MSLKGHRTEDEQKHFSLFYLLMLKFIMSNMVSHDAVIFLQEAHGFDLQHLKTELSK